MEITPMFVRFRADPSKIRISVRRRGRLMWAVRVKQVPFEGIKPTYFRGTIKAHGYNLYETVIRALARAEMNELDGIDLSMGFTYPHPFMEDENEDFRDSRERNDKACAMRSGSTSRGD